MSEIDKLRAERDLFEVEAGRQYSDRLKLQRDIAELEKALESIQGERDEQFSEAVRLKADRDEWREQHENLLGLYRSAVAEVASLKEEWAEHDGVTVLERALRRAESEATAMRAKVERCKAVLSRRYSEPGHWENPNGDLCSADELEAALEDK